MKTKRILSLFLALLMVFTMIPGSVFAEAAAGNAEAEENTFTGEEKVVVSVEGLTLGQGFYVEPTVYTFDELIAAAKAKGETKTASEITAQDAILLAIEDGGYTPNMVESPYGGEYLSGIKGADKGYVNLPDILKDKVTLTENSDTELGEYDYTTTGGWLFSEHNASASVGMGEYTLSSYGESYTVDGEEYYVIRFMFSIYNFGADLGFEGWDSTPSEENPWGSAVEPLFEAADRSEAYAKYAALKAEGFFAEHANARTDALQIMERLDASKQYMSNVYQMLVQAEEDALKNTTTKNSEKTEAGAPASTAAQTEAAKTTASQSSQKVENEESGDSQAPLFWTVFMVGGASAGVIAARKKRACENGKNS